MLRSAVIALLLFLASCSGGRHTETTNDTRTAGMPPTTGGIVEQLLNGTDPMVVAHRGCWRDSQENSLAAIKVCIATGVAVVELDVRRSKDGVLVLMHDETVDRTTNGSGRVSDLLFSELSDLNLRTADGGSEAAISAETVPSFAEALRIAKGRILINADVKSNDVTPVMALLTEMEMLDQVIMKLEVPPDDPQLRNPPYIGKTHFMPKITHNIQPLSATAPTYAYTKPVAYELKFETEDYLVEGRAAIEAADARIRINTLEPHKCAYHDDSVAILDPAAHWGALLDLGVNMIQTDYPRELIEYLGSR